MHVAREAVVGAATFVAFFSGAVALGSQSASASLRAVSVLAGIGGGGAAAVFAALAAHLAGRPAGYEPVEGEDAAWGVGELEE